MLCPPNVPLSSRAMGHAVPFSVWPRHGRIAFVPRFLSTSTTQSAKLSTQNLEFSCRPIVSWASLNPVPTLWGRTEEVHRKFQSTSCQASKELVRRWVLYPGDPIRSLRANRCHEICQEDFPDSSKNCQKVGRVMIFSAGGCKAPFPGSTIIKLGSCLQTSLKAQLFLQEPIINHGEAHF